MSAGCARGFPRTACVRCCAIRPPGCSTAGPGDTGTCGSAASRCRLCRHDPRPDDLRTQARHPARRAACPLAGACRGAGILRDHRIHRLRTHRRCVTMVSTRSGRRCATFPPAPGTLSVRGLRRKPLLHPYPAHRLVRNPGVDALEVLVPPAQRVLLEVEESAQVARSRPISLQMRASAATRRSMSSSRWRGVGVKRRRSVPRATVG